MPSHPLYHVAKELQILLDSNSHLADDSFVINHVQRQLDNNEIVTAFQTLNDQQNMLQNMYPEIADEFVDVIDYFNEEYALLKELKQDSDALFADD